MRAQRDAWVSLTVTFVSVTLPVLVTVIVQCAVLPRLIVCSIGLLVTAMAALLGGAGGLGAGDGVAGGGVGVGVGEGGAAALSSLVIVHVTDSVKPTVMLLPDWVPPTHDQLLAVYPAGPDSDNA